MLGVCSNNLLWTGPPNHSPLLDSRPRFACNLNLYDRKRVLEDRLQVLLDESRYQEVAQEAERRRASIGAVIHEAIDCLDAQTDRQRQAIASLLAAASMEVPEDRRELRRELDDAMDSFAPRT